MPPVIAEYMSAPVPATTRAANVDALHATWRATGLDDGELVRTLLTFNAAAPVFADGAQRVQFRAKEDV